MHPREGLLVVSRMLNLTSDETIGIAEECLQASTGAEIHDRPAIDRAGILVLITDLASTDCLQYRLTWILIHQSFAAFGFSILIIEP